MASFTFCRVEPKDYKEALNLFWNHFMPDEPVTRLVGCCTRTGYRIHNLDKMLSEMLNKRTCWMAKSFEGEMAPITLETEELFVNCKIVLLNKPYQKNM